MSYMKSVGIYIYDEVFDKQAEVLTNDMGKISFLME